MNDATRAQVKTDAYNITTARHAGITPKYVPVAPPPPEYTPGQTIDTFNVLVYGAEGDGLTNDRTAIQNAINAASVAGGGIVFFPRGTYLVNNRIEPKSNVTLRGVPNASILKISINEHIIVKVTGDLSNFTVDSMTFVGPVNEFPTSPQRTRTTSGSGATTAIYLSGNGDPFQASAGNISNITIKDCRVENCTSLPIRIAGTKGFVRVTGCTFINNLDPGFIFNEEVVFNGNHSLMGADNGVSLSRGNKKVTCVGNTIENCAFEGIFIGGFDINEDADIRNIGPTNFTITGNTVKNVGRNGIYLDAAPKRGVVSGNMVQQGYFRGPVGALTDVNSVGIYIAGYPFPYDAPTAYAEDIQVTGNMVYECGRAGVEVFAAKRINIDSNLFVNCGTPYKADGTTPIASNDVTSNVGVLIRSAGSPEYITVRNNTVVDNRITPYTNYGIVPFNNIPATYEFAGNRMIGCRNAYNLVDYSPHDRVYQGSAAIIPAKGINDAHNNRVVTITDNASTTPNFLNVQGSVAGQAVALAAESFTETTIPMTFRTKGAATFAVRPGADLTTAFQVRRSDNVSANSVVNVDTTNQRVGINTITPASELHVVGTIRATDALLTNPLPVANGGTGQATLTSLPMTTPRVTNGINDANGNRIITLTATASAVNNLTVQNAVSGQNVAFGVSSPDTDAGVTFKSKGAGTMVFRPETDTLLAAQWRKADNSTVVMDIDTTNARVGIGTTTPADALDVAGNIRSYHLMASGTAPTYTAGDGAGTAPTIVLTGKDTAGNIACTIGTSPQASAAVITVNFNVAFPNAPAVVLTPGNALTAALSGTKAIYVTRTTAGFTINAGSTNLTTGEQMIWYYQVIGS